jgi:hypothetical protein
MYAEVRMLRAVNAALGREIEALKGENAALKKLDERSEQIIALAQTAITARSGANQIDDLRVKDCQQQLARADQMIARQDAEIHRLRNPGFFREMFSPDTLWKFGAGFAVGRAR